MADSSPADRLEGALDRLYAATLDEFMSLRGQLVAELRAAGEAATARQVAGVAKPARTAWALNQVARREPELLQAVMKAWATANEAQKRGDAAALRETARAYREWVAAVVKAARDVLAEAGMEATAIQMRRMGETLQAASAEDSPTRARLLAGRLEKDADVQDPLAGLEAGPGAGAKTKDDRRAAQAAQEAAQEKERAITAARKQVDSLEKAAAKARAAAREAEVNADRARDEADRARRAVGEAEARVVQATTELRKLGG
jgi:hypothetical protein